MKQPTRGSLNSRPIVIKRIKKVEGGHHGGAWKVAYADFMTAMMAFFLLLWILSSPDETKLEGLAQYFKDIDAIPLVNIGGEGMLDGSSIENAQLYADQNNVVDQPSESTDDQSPDPVTEKTASGAVSKNPWAELVETREKEANAVANGAAKFTTIEEQLKLLSQSFSAFGDAVIITAEKDRMKINILDVGEVPMFHPGSTSMSKETARIMLEVAKTIMTTDGVIHITGHTDATPYRGKGGYSNWELSADRANSTRRALIKLGVPERRFGRVIGAAETSPFVPSDPTAAANRRVTVEIISEKLLDQQVIHP